MKHTKQIGMSLVESLVALVLISGGIVALISFQSGTLKEGSLASQRLEASSLAQQQLDILRNYIDQTGFNTIVANLDNNDAANQVQGRSSIFTRTWDVTTMNSGDKRVIVTVQWPDNNTGAFSNDTTVQLSSIMTSITPDAANSASAAGIPLAPDVVIDTVDCQCEGTNKSTGGGHGGHGGHMAAAQIDNACSTCCGLTTTGSKGMMAKRLSVEAFYASLSRPRYPQSATSSGWHFLPTAMAVTTNTCDVSSSGMVTRK